MIKRALALVITLVCLNAWAAVDAVLVGQGSTQTAAVTTAPGTTQATGSTFYVAACYGADQTNNTPTDTYLNTYTLVGTAQNDPSVVGRAVVYKCENCGGGALHTATMTFSGTAFPTLFLVEVTGAATASFDKTAQGTDSSSPFTITSPTLSQASEVVLTNACVNVGVSGTNTYSSSNTTILGQQADGVNYFTAAVSKLVVSSTSAVTPSFTDTEGTAGALILATFKSASSPATVNSNFMLFMK